MAVRGSMTYLISRVRDEIGDDAGATQTFSDERIQQFLDRYQDTYRYLMLLATPDILPGSGSVVYYTYFAEEGEWEDDVALVDRAWQPVTPSEADLVVGRWKFATNTTPPVYLTGKNYDVAAACADLCQAWASKFAQSYDFKTHSQQMMRSQQITHYQQMEQGFRSRAKPQKAAMIRSDVC